MLGWILLVAIVALLFVWQYDDWLREYFDSSKVASAKQILIWIVAIGFLGYMYDTKLFHS